MFYERTMITHEYDQKGRRSVEIGKRYRSAVDIHKREVGRFGSERQHRAGRAGHHNLRVSHVVAGGSIPAACSCAASISGCVAAGNRAVVDTGKNTPIIQHFMHVSGGRKGEQKQWAFLNLTTTILTAKF